MTWDYYDFMIINGICFDDYILFCFQMTYGLFYACFTIEETEAQCILG